MKEGRIERDGYRRSVSSLKRNLVTLGLIIRRKRTEIEVYFLRPFLFSSNNRLLRLLILETQKEKKKKGKRY